MADCVIAPLANAALVNAPEAILVESIAFEAIFALEIALDAIFALVMAFEAIASASIAPVAIAAASIAPAANLALVIAPVANTTPSVPVSASMLSTTVSTVASAVAVANWSNCCPLAMVCRTAAPLCHSSPLASIQRTTISSPFISSAVSVISTWPELAGDSLGSVPGLANAPPSVLTLKSPAAMVGVVFIWLSDCANSTIRNVNAAFLTGGFFVAIPHP